MTEALRPGDPGQVGPYRLARRLGSGGMGQVYLGHSPGGRPVAVKVIRPDLAAEASFRARFGREVAAARLVSGMFTALVVDADPQAEMPWLATAYVAGPSLAQAVAMHGPLPLAELVALAAGLAEGLAAVHAAGLVHRDLKPTNVLLAQDGPRVIDFGISRAVEESALTGTGLVVGSPGFMSPEQADGREVGPASDVFSLGAVIAFAATGTGPFGSGAAPALLYRVVHGAADLDGLPGEIRGLARRCLAKDPAARPTPAQILGELGTPDVASGWLPWIAAAGKADHPATEVADVKVPDSAATVTSARVRSSRTPVGGPEPRRAGRRRARLVIPLVVAGLLAVSGVVAAQVLGRGAGNPGSSSGGAAQRSPPSTGSPPSSPDGSATPAISAGNGPLGASRGTGAPIPPAQVTAAAVSQYVVRVTWAPASPGATGYFVDNDCPACVAGAYLSKRTGAATSADLTVTPGSYQCFRVYAFNATGSSGWSSTLGCIGTPPLTVPAASRWTDTGVRLAAGIVVGISATGSISAYPAGTEGPDGDPTCTPASRYPGATPAFTASGLPCWSLLARIGSGSPFEIGVSHRFETGSAGELYLGVNANDFAQNSGGLTVKIKKGGLP